MNQFRKLRVFNVNQVLRGIGVTGVVITGLALTTLPALAHHPMGGRTPSNLFEGFLSGIGHPVVGLDHLAFVIAIGLLAATQRRGLVIPLAFVLTAILGTATHLSGISFPGVELLVSGSILLFGLLLTLKNKLNLGTIAGLSAAAGLFHGYAYGEAIFGAETTPLLAYLTGFTVMQLVIALSALWIGRALVVQPEMGQQPARLRSAGLVLCGIGLAFFTSQLVSVLFPVANS